jgi:hypothetical protein
MLAPRANGIIARIWYEVTEAAFVEALKRGAIPVIVFAKLGRSSSSYQA